jgi:TetR/AcrR family transcriptional repressor of bet genes
MTPINAERSQHGRTAIRQARRQQLIDATIDSIAKNGFSATTLATVTKGAKLSHGVINFHFKSKEALYVDTLGYMAQEHYDHWFTAMENAGPAPAQKLAAIIETDFKPNICSQKKLAVWFAFWGQAKYRPNYLKIHHKFDDMRLISFKHLCGEIIEEGGYNQHDPGSTARRIEALIDGLWLNLLLYPREIKRQEALNDCFSYLSNVFPKHFPLPSDGPDRRDAK